MDEKTPPPSYELSVTQPPLRNEIPEQPIIITQQTIHFGPESTAIVCPHCQTRMNTRVESQPSTKTHMAALLIFCCLCWPCAWIPYVCDSCQNRVHYCSSCNNYLGVYNN